MLRGDLASLVAEAAGVGRRLLAAGNWAVIRASTPSKIRAEPVWRPFRSITTNGAGEAASKGAQDTPEPTLGSTDAAGSPQQPSASPGAGIGAPIPQGLHRSSADYAVVLKLAQQIASHSGGGIMARGSAGVVSGVREVALSPRRVLIFSNARSPEQQGRQKTGFNREFPHWSIEFLDVTDKWVNPLIGWTSSPDTKHQAAVALQFYKAEEAITFCERQGWEYEVAPPNEPREGRGRRWATYGDNFSIKRHGLPDLSHLPSNQPQGKSGVAKGDA
ncbi:hypothetical protein Vretimale_2976 [Volvox reticuliferus]|uniref:NADH dehydrogenase [ubiquinone] iron-sulfur protein 4, mitochondrial n=1 Tax=Volvox reticuliferus TaxID=1737510 RepID=A0A8J4C9K8_9CHLO|nr:hypothetical protein Vretifemale_6916 [Volvox reticuliferus]GIL97249.1 hypothetical protein Vretimale_2976 [Volvox reticuliferus]